MRFQAQGNQLQATRLFAVNNASKPPRTQKNDQNFEFYLPDGAQIADSSAETAGGQPLKTDPVPQKEKNRYALNFPLRPGQTLFQIGFELPYSGELSVDPVTRRVGVGDRQVELGLVWFAREGAQE